MSSLSHFEPFSSMSSGTRENISNALSGGTAALTAILVNQPLEMMRIRSQLLEKASRRDSELILLGYKNLGKKLWREEGWRGFYRGMGLRMMTTIPGTMLALSGYETVKSLSKSESDPH